MEKSEEYSLGDITPAERMEGSMNVLKDVASADSIDPTQRKSVEEQITNITSSVIGSLGKDITPEKLKENQELLVALSGKGFEKATEALSQLDAASKEKAGVNLDTMMSSDGDKRNGHLKETLSELSNDGNGPMPEVGRPAIFNQTETMHKNVENNNPALANALKKQGSR